MTDEKFVFVEDLREKKSAARGSFHKKRGSKSKQCSLPSDSLTPAQIRKLNGEVVMYKIGEPIGWKEFKRYPAEMQQKWVNSFAERFDCTGKGLELVFGVKNPSIYPLLKQNGVSLPKCGAYSQKKGEAIRAWIESFSEPKEEVKPEVVVPAKPAPVVEVKPEPKKPEMPYFVQTLKQGSMELSGTATEIFHTLFGIFRDAKIELSINFEVIPEPEVEDEGPLDIVVPDEDVEDLDDGEDAEEDDGRLDLNHCVFKDLRDVGFSPNIAATIMQRRPFAAVDDLLNVPGVNGKLYQIVKHKVKV